MRRLESLGPDQLRAVQRYEASTRNRRTILNRAGQLLDEAAERPVLRLTPVELARPAVAADRQACRGCSSQALVGAASMRGGAALRRRRHPGDAPGPLDTGPEVAQLFVGEYDDVVVGLVAVTTFETLTGSGAAAGSSAATSRPGRAGVGVGTALMEAVVEWCGARGCAEVDALALPGDRSTKQRLEAAGFTARLLTLSRRLG